MQIEKAPLVEEKIEYKNCDCCGKTFSYFKYVEYKYKFDPKGFKGPKFRKYFCSYSCFIKGKVESILHQERLTKNDVRFLQDHNREVPWEKCSDATKKYFAEMRA